MLLLTGFLATILMRVLKNDFVKYSRDDEALEDQEETGGRAGRGWAVGWGGAASCAACNWAVQPLLKLLAPHPQTPQGPPPRYPQGARPCAQGGSTFMAMCSASRPTSTSSARWWAPARRWVGARAGGRACLGCAGHLEEEGRASACR